MPEYMNMNQNYIFELLVLFLRKLTFIRVYAKVIWRVFWSASWNFSAFIISLKFGFQFLCSTLLRPFCLAFVFDVLKESSTLCHIYLTPDLQSLKLVGFKVAKTCKKNMEILTFLTRWRWWNSSFEFYSFVLSMLMKDNLHILLRIFKLDKYI